jgi:hypothetical protein
MYGSRSLEKKNHVFGLRKTVYSRKNPKIKIKSQATVSDGECSLL